MTISYARVRTEKASEYLVSFSKAWLRSVPDLQFNDRLATIRFPFASCELNAGDGFLEITLTAKSKEYAELLEDVVADRLDGFARDETLKYQWTLQ
ncbi:MAG TPA: DUF2218 domain-containing protein [Rhizomicrobium sp.]|jgi:hypothetical protein|nr:DUF2218 domain-containing protein [Rhizomicrobium sp.]